MKPSCRHVLNRLRQGPATTHDLMQADVGGVRFGARLKELRDLGFDVAESRLPLPTRGSTYRLVSEPEIQSDGPVVSSACGTGRGSAEARGAEFVGSSDTPEVSAGSPATTHASLFDPEPFAERGRYRDAA